jgi:signal transduction histidine kinase
LTLNELMERMLPALRDRAAQAGMELEVRIDPAHRAALLNVDPAAVEQIVFNLIDNACKYGRAEGAGRHGRTAESREDHGEFPQDSTPGRIFLSAAAGEAASGHREGSAGSGDGGRNGSVEIRVADSGPGISPRDHARLFRPFHKSAREAAHSAPGVGLGLALSRRLARRLGGDLWLSPVRGGEQAAGACFVLRLPNQSLD